MIVNLIILAIFIVLIVLAAWLALRAWRSKNAAVKWGGTILAGLLALVLLAVTFVMGKGFYELYRPYHVATVNVSVAGTPEQVARGQHLAGFVCASCHSKNGELPLSGGKNLSEDTGMPLGDVYPANITPGGKLRELSDSDVFRILRTGIEPGGRLTAMAFFPVRNLSDEDAQAIIAYLRQAPSVENTPPALNPSPLLLALVGLGAISPEAANTPIQPVTAPPKAVTAEYGKYVMSFGDCVGCHGPALTGNAPPPAPPGAANLTVVMPQWSKDDFFKAMRTGVDPTGHQISSVMPWRTIGKLDDVELEALYVYLHGLTPILPNK